MNDGFSKENPEERSSDASLLLLVERRDEAAMASLFQRHSRIVYSVALRVLHDPAQAEDVLQDVFMQVWKKPISLNDQRGSLSGLLAVIARNRAIDLLRQRRHSESTDEYDVASPFDLAGDSERRLLLDRVRQVAGNLPAEQRAVLGLAFFDGMTHAEIATMTGTPLGTVKTRIRSAVQTLERTLAA